MKTCVLMGTSYVGKTETIKKICEMFEKDAKCIEKDDKINNGNDIVAIYQDNKNNYIIGLISIGDTVEQITMGYERIESIIKEKNLKINYLICASKSYGMTVEYLEKKSEKVVKIMKNYFVESDNYKCNKEHEGSMNLSLAKYIYDNLYIFFDL